MDSDRKRVSLYDDEEEHVPVKKRVETDPCQSTEPLAAADASSSSGAEQKLEKPLSESCHQRILSTAQWI